MATKIKIKNDNRFADLFDAYVNKMTDRNWDKFVAAAAEKYAMTDGGFDFRALMEDMAHLRSFHGSGLTSYDTVYDVRCMICKYGLVSEWSRQDVIRRGRVEWCCVGAYEVGE